MKHIVNRDAKKIALDRITREFLGSLRELRIMHGLKMKDVAECVKVHKDSLGSYEIGTRTPQIKILMNLAEYYGADISGSINYQYWHGQIDFAGIRRELSEYGLTYERLSELTGYALPILCNLMNDPTQGSLEMLSAVIEILTRTRSGEIPRCAVKKGGLHHGIKLSCPDEITLEFLRTLKARRISMGLTQAKLARMVGVSLESLRLHETGQTMPTLTTLMRLAEIFGVDITASINSKYHRGEINFASVRKGLERYGLTKREIARMTSYSDTAIHYSVKDNARSSLEVLSAVLDVLDHERESYHFRDEICRAERRKHKHG